MIDLHTHLWRHEPGTVLPTYEQLARYCERAATVGVREIAITEHCNRFEEIADVVLPIWRRGDAPALLAAADRVWSAERGARLDAYVTCLTEAQARGLPILVGLEVDALPGADAALAELLRAYPFDLLLGSVHWIGAWLFDAYGDPAFAAEWDRRPIDDAWDLYVDAVSGLARSGNIDVIAHVDVIKVTGRRPGDIDRFETRLCTAIAESGVAVEVSSAGLRKPVAEMYPSPTLLRLLHDAGVPFTTASDAHDIDQVGDRFGDLYRSLRDLGVDELTTFSRREPRRVRDQMSRAGPLASLPHD